MAVAGRLGAFLLIAALAASPLCTHGFVPLGRGAASLGSRGLAVVGHSRVKQCPREGQTSVRSPADLLHLIPLLRPPLKPPVLTSAS